VELIKNIDNIAKTRLKSLIRKNFQNGGKAEEMINEIQKIADFHETRARLIARDQTSKLEGTVDKLSQISIGITHYIWVTQGDERVRDSHKALNGTTRQWGFGIEPKQEINCRCYALPVTALLF
jgi:SPP1 gp7 family putative phage head morphogenesis protein